MDLHLEAGGGLPPTISEGTQLQFYVYMRVRGGEETEIEGDALTCLARMLDILEITPETAARLLIHAALTNSLQEVSWPYELLVEPL